MKVGGETLTRTVFLQACVKKARRSGNYLNLRNKAVFAAPSLRPPLSPKGRENPGFLPECKTRISIGSIRQKINFFWLLQAVTNL